MKIFFSWQSDTPAKIGRRLIRSALDDAIDKLSAELELSDADRPDVDQDTQGVMGNPAIADTILEKIKLSDVVVVDLTIVGKAPNDKGLINSNVAYELGYTHRHHGHEPIIGVMNTHYGDQSHLPFDLQHRRWPVAFSVSEDAGKAERDAAQASLAKHLVPILKVYLERHAVDPEKKNGHEPIESTAHPGAYWKPQELLVDTPKARGYEDGVHLRLADNQPLSYLRVWPADQKMESLSGQELSNLQTGELNPFGSRTMGSSTARNPHGKLIYGCNGGDALLASTQIFNNREIWGLEAILLRDRSDEEDGNYVPTSALEKGFISSLGSYLRFAEQYLGYADRAHFEAGIVNVAGYRLAMGNSYFERFWGPIYDPYVRFNAEVKLGDYAAIDAALLGFFEAIFDAAGAARPQGLSGFPPAA